MPPGRDAATGRFTSGGGVDLGHAFASVRIDRSGVASDINAIQQQFRNGLSQLAPAMQSFGQGLSRIGDSLSIISAPLAAFSAQGIRTASDFQNLLKQIEVFGGLTGAQLEQVRALALQLGRDTIFSSADAAAAMLDMIKAGMSTEEAMASLRSTLDLAAAGELSLAQAASIVTSGLAQFGLTADQTNRITNALARGANASRASVAGLGQGLANVGPVAASMGLSIEDTIATLAVLTQNGIDAAESGTALRSMLLNMTQDTEPANAAWAQLGVSFYNADGSARNLDDVFRDLDASLDRLPVQEQNRLMQDLFGTYGIVAANAIRTAGGIDGMRASMDESADAAEVAAAFNETFAGKLEALKGSIETLMINAFTPLMENHLTPLVERITSVVNGINDWVNLNPELVQRIGAIGGALIGLGPVLSILGRVIMGIFTPIGLILTALSALGLAWNTNFLGIRDTLQPFIDTFVEGIGDLSGGGVLGAIGRWQENMESGGLSLAVSSVLANVLQMFGATEDGSMQFVQGIAGNLQELGTAAAPAVNEFGGLLGDLGQTLSDLWLVVQPHLQNLANWFIQDALPAVFAFVRDVALPGVRNFIVVLRAIWEEVSPHLIRLADWFLNTGLPAIRNFIVDQVAPRVQDFINLLVGIWEAVRPHLERLYEWFVTDALPAVRDFIVDEALPAVQDFLDTLEGAWEFARVGLMALSNWFTYTLRPQIETAVGAGIGIWENFKTILSTLWELARPHLEPIVNWFRDTFQYIGRNYIQPVLDFINSIINRASEALNFLRMLGGGAPSAAPNVGSNMYSKPALATTISGQLGNQVNANVGGIRVSGYRDSGGVGRAGEAYVIGKGAQPEMFVPSQNGSFIPNVDQLLGKGGDTMYITIQANSRAEGEAAAAGLEARLKEVRRARG